MAAGTSADSFGCTLRLWAVDMPLVRQMRGSGKAAFQPMHVASWFTLMYQGDCLPDMHMCVYTRLFAGRLACIHSQEEARQAIVRAPGMVERLQACRADVAGELVREAARGCLFTLGLEEHTLTRHALRMHTAGWVG